MVRSLVTIEICEIQKRKTIAKRYVRYKSMSP